uniref:S8 family peptidase n=1 Tax=Ningiella ruwaisensis TaxID=2364274 RepID=UPI0010A0338D|nr:S8 family peptidase [Ningiella ruwaisensis]
MKSLGRLSYLVAAITVGTISLGSVNGDMSTITDHMFGAGGAQEQVQQSYIIQGSNAERLVDVVETVGGDVNKQFPIINAISAVLTPSQAEELKKVSGVRILDDRTVTTMNKGQTKKHAIDTYINKQINANDVHDLGFTGQGVTVAVVDSGANMGGDIGQYLFRDSNGNKRALVKYDTFKGQPTYYYNDDNNGHGSHISGIIASSLRDGSGDFNGVAPDVFLLSIKAFDDKGNSSYSHVLDALNWISMNRYTYGIKVVNLSLGAEVNARYYNDPLNQAVMALWHQGITVVTSAGNNGREMGITVPGNNPYVITVGTSAHNDTPYDISDDRIASFSAEGPTFEGFVKPEVVAPGAEVAVKMNSKFFKKAHKKNDKGADYFEISGTSQSSAVVAGIAALIIQAHPGIRPDDVKCKIISSTRLAKNSSNSIYSPLVQGHGMVNAYEAVTSNATGCANNGLDVVADLTGTQHFFGPVEKKDGLYEISLADGTVLLEGAHWTTETVVIEGAHWTTESIELKGAHWTTESIELKGAHWTTESIELKGAHWTTESVELKGAHWTTESVELKGAHWTTETSPAMGVDLDESQWQ